MITFLVVILLIYLCAYKPSISYNLPNDDDYMHIDKTRLINGLFIALVLISHIYNGINGTENQLCASDLFFEKNIVRKIGQLMVVPFFFFSGYGIMYSFDRKINYSTSIIKRFISLFLNFNIAISLYIALNIFIDKLLFISNFNIYSYIKTAIAWQNLGNQNWFIFATFSLYIFCIISFNLFKNYKRCLIKPTITLLTLIYIYIVGSHQSYVWIDTVLCFPAGMYFYCYRAKFDTILRNIKFPKWILGIALILFSQAARFFTLQFRIDNKLDFISAFGTNIVSIIFAFGILLLFSCIKWRKKPTILIWMGGVGLFPIYMLHMLPIIILTNYKLHTNAPNICIFLIVAITLLLSLIMSKVFSKVSSKIK